MNSLVIPVYRNQENLDRLLSELVKLDARVNGEWDVQSILKLCPMVEEDALMIFARLLERGIIELRKP